MVEAVRTAAKKNALAREGTDRHILLLTLEEVSWVVHVKKLLLQKRILARNSIQMYKICRNTP